MNGAEFLIDFLTQKKVRQVYGYPGGPVLVLFEAIYKAGFPHILTRHEQGAAHAAEGYAKVSGLPGVCFATSGPGATNLVTGLADAQLDSVPILAITGAVARKATGTDAFQEADITGVTRSITKYNYLVMNPDELMPILEEAWELTTSGRPGPVLVNIPKDLLAMPVDPSASRASSNYVRHRPPVIRTRAMTDKVYAALAGCRKPLLLAGGGCVISRNGADRLEAFAESVGIPVATTLMGKGAIADSHPLSLGFLGMHGSPQANVALGTCDLLLVVGSRLSDRVIGDPELFNSKDRVVVHVDIDLAEIGKNIRTDIEIEDDAADFFETMLGSRPAGDFSAAWQDWLAMLADKRQKYQDLKEGMYKADSPLHPQYVIHEIAQRLRGQNPVVVTDVGQHQMFVAQHFPVESPRSFVTSGGLGTMGFGLPASIGASAAAPDRTVVLFTGDGGFQMTIQELGLLAKLKPNVKVFIMDNGCLGMVHQWQELFFKKHFSCSILDNNPDFLKIAAAYGLPGGQAMDGPSLAHEIDKALESQGPYIIRCILDPRDNVYPMIPAGKLPQDLIMPGMDG